MHFPISTFSVLKCTLSYNALKRKTDYLLLLGDKKQGIELYKPMQVFGAPNTLTADGRDNYDIRNTIVRGKIMTKPLHSELRNDKIDQKKKDTCFKSFVAYIITYGLRFGH